MENINNFQGMLECFFIFGIFFVLLLLDWLYVHGTKRKTVFVVKEKGTLTHGRVSDGNGATWTNFMIYTKDGRAFKNINTVWAWKWRSTELQAQIKVGKNMLLKFMAGVSVV